MNRVNVQKGGVESESKEIKYLRLGKKLRQLSEVDADGDCAKFDSENADKVS